MFWLGIQSANGAVCVTVMIEAIWPSYANIPNHIAADQGITTQGMIRFVLSLFETFGFADPSSVTSSSG